jgi:hypothetical protein
MGHAKKKMPQIFETPNISLFLFSKNMRDEFQKNGAGSG